jgi:formate dehydrogenase major subunit
MDLDRRSFLKAGGGAALASSMAILGFGEDRKALAQAVRPYKLARTTETRNTCPYCSVSCGILMYSLGDKSKNAKAEIIHIEGDPDHPVNRGTLCPKGAGLLDFVRAKTRTKYPLHRKPGSDKWERVSWDFALDRIAKLMKEDRDANLITQNAAGQTVNRWTSTGMLAASATTNETAWLTWKTVRSLGMVVFDNQARV